MAPPPKKNHRVFIEWTVVQSQLFEIQTGTFTTHGFLVCLLPQQWWCYRKMLNHFKFYNALFNGMALLLMATGMIAGPILESSTLVACLAAVGKVVKGWNDFKKYRFKVKMSRFAFTTYAKALIELRTYVRGIPFEGLEGFLIKMQTLDDTIIDFTPPLPKRCVQEYCRQFFYQPMDAQCYVDGCHRPLMSKSYWTEKDKKCNPYSPTLLYSTPWPSEENEKKEKERKDEDDNKEVDGGKI